MSFSQYILAVTYFMAALGIFSVSLVESIEPIFAALMAAGAALSLYLNLKKKELIPARVWTMLAVVVFMMFITDYFAISQSLISSSARFLTVLLALKLFDLKTNRDYLIVYALVFFQILAAAASTVSPVFVLILLIFIMDAIFAMTVFTIKRDWQEHAGKGKEPPAGIFDARFFVSIAAVSVASLAVGFLLFFIIPRLGVGFFENKTLNTVKVTGFSERVDLGSIGPVKTDPTVVMRVELTGRAGPPGKVLHFRGTALDLYDGKSWSRSIRPGRALVKDASGSFAVSPARGEVLEQSILLEPLDTDVIFAASQPFEVSGTFANLRADSAGAIYLPAPLYQRVEYRARSDISGVRDDPGDKAGIYTDATAVMNGEAGARLAELVSRVTAGKNTDMDKAAAIERYLKGGFSYTLDPRKGAGLNPIDDFLFFSKQGYCEQFASSMVVMARAAGVPARLVTGFLQGEWNSYGNYFIVRQRDAHSWVEAYIRGTGWVQFDPTPSAGLVPSFMPSRLSLYLDMLRFKWSRYVINYTLADQMRFTSKVDAHRARVFGGIRNVFKSSTKRQMRIAIAVFSAVFLAAILFVVLNWTPFERRKKNPKTPLFYLEMLRALRGKGYERGDSETPMEFAQRTGNPAVKRVTTAFQDARYGRAALEEAVAERIKKDIEGLKRLKKKG